MFGSIIGILASRNNIVIGNPNFPLDLYGDSFTFLGVTQNELPISISSAPFSFGQDISLPAPIIPIEYDTLINTSFIGNISSFPILLSGELEDRYWANVDLLLQGNGTIQDGSPYRRIMTKVGTPQITIDSKFGSGAIQFDGTGQALTTTISAFRQQDFTIEFWIKFNTIPSAGQLGIIGNLPATPYWFIGINFLGQIFATINGITTNSSVVTTDVWYFVSVQRKDSISSSGKAIYLYLDGVLNSYNDGTLSDLTDTSFKIGKYSNTDMGIDAIIDDVRITLGVARPVVVPVTEFYSENILPLEVPVISINSISVLETVGTANFTVSLSYPFSQDVTVDYQTIGITAIEDEDFVFSSSTLTILAGQTTGTIPISIIADGVIEANETFNVVLSNPVNATLGISTGVCTIQSQIISSATILNPADISSGVVLSNNNLTATENTSSEAHIRALDGFTTGKYYWEIYCNVSGSLNTALGIRSVNEALTTSFGSGQTWSSRSTGQVFAGSTGGIINYSTSWNAGDTVMLAVDKDAGKMWVGINGTWVGSGNPVTGVNPMITGTLTGEWKPYIAADNTGSNHTWTARFSTNDFVYTMPSGYQEVVQIAPPSGNTYQHWRLYVTANDGDSSYVSFSEINLFDANDVEYAVNQRVTATQSGNGSVGSAADGADGDQNTEAGSSIVGSLSTNPYWWQIDLGQERTISYMKLRSQRVVTGRTPANFILQGATSASGPWVDVKIVSGSTGWGIQEERTFTV